MICANWAVYLHAPDVSCREKNLSMRSETVACTRQCANYAAVESIQAMANLDLLRQGCFLFSVFLEAGENAGSEQGEGLASLSLIFTHPLNMLNVRGIKMLLFLYSGPLKNGRGKDRFFETHCQLTLPNTAGICRL